MKDADVAEALRAELWMILYRWTQGRRAFLRHTEGLRARLRALCASPK